MRNAMTDQYGERLQASFIKSGKTADDFMEYLWKSRPAITWIDMEFAEPEDGIHVTLNEGVLHCYFANNRWHCKF